MSTGPVQPGQPLRIEAGTWNRLLALANGTQAPGGPAPSPLSARAHLVRIRNDSGGAVTATDVLGIDGPLFDPTYNPAEARREPLLAGSAPDVGLHRGRFAIVATAAPAGGIALAYADGICPAWVDVTDAYHRWADIVDGDATKLVSCGYPTSAELLYPSTTGEIDTVIRLGRDPTGQTFAVDLTKTGGDGGAHPANWTYRVELYGVTLMEDAEPESARPDLAASDGTLGLAYVDLAGQMHLHSANETLLVCEDTGGGGT